MISAATPSAPGLLFDDDNPVLLGSADFKPGPADDLLLEHIQRQTFRYFWDFGHPQSGTARERNHEQYRDVISTGGSGFGLMAMLVAAERNWISSHDFLQRVETIIGFLFRCRKYQGAFSHWYHGEIGETIRFGKKDDGADLVETSFLVMGLLCLRQYLRLHYPSEKLLTDKITALWLNVDWNAFTRGKNTLYWHWTPHHRKQINLPIEGWNEALVTYVLAAASPTHPIAASVYHKGWARKAAMKNGNRFYDSILPLGPDYGGPLFFAYFSFLGLDPRHLNDAYADYWKQNTAHAYINYAHCVNNPKGYKGYGKHCWGLSSCDSGKKYKPLHPQKDNGTICPSAAISCLPYLPREAMKALHHFYFNLGKKIWGAYGFTDGFNKTRSWYSQSWLAINQGASIIAIENFRTGMLWKLFMDDDDVQKGLVKLGFDHPVLVKHLN